MSHQFTVNPEQLSANATANAEHAQKLRAWIDQYDNPQRYAQLETRLGAIGYPVVQALRRQGALVRERTLKLIASYETASEASRTAAARSVDTDNRGSVGIRSSVEGL